MPNQHQILQAKYEASYQAKKQKNEQKVAERERMAQALKEKVTADIQAKIASLQDQCVSDDKAVAQKAKLSIANFNKELEKRLGKIDHKTAKFKRKHVAVTYEAKVERLRYQNNKMSQLLVFAGLFFGIVLFIMMYENRRIVPKMAHGIDVLLNIVFILTLFLASEKVKAYNRNWGIAAIAIGWANALRIFFIPLMAKKTVYTDGNIQISSQLFTRFVILYLMIGVALTIAGVVCLYKERALRAYLESEEENNG